MSYQQEIEEHELKIRRKREDDHREDPIKKVTQLALSKAAADLALAQKNYDSALKEFKRDEHLYKIAEKTNEIVTEGQENHQDTVKTLAAVNKTLSEIDPNDLDSHAILQAAKKILTDTAVRCTKEIGRTVKTYQEQSKIPLKDFDAKESLRDFEIGLDQSQQLILGSKAERANIAKQVKDLRQKNNLSRNTVISERDLDLAIVQLRNDMERNGVSFDQLNDNKNFMEGELVRRRNALEQSSTKLETVGQALETAQERYNQLLQTRQTNGLSNEFTKMAKEYIDITQQSPNHIPSHKGF